MPPEQRSSSTTVRPGRPARSTATARSAGSPAAAVLPPRRRPGPEVRRFLGLLALTGLIAVIVLAITSETASQLAASGGIATFAGNLTAMAGTYLALVMVLLMSRVPLIERTIGLDQLARLHRRLSPWPLSLIAAHAVLTTVGYAQAARSGAWSELGTFVSTYPDMLTAVVGFGLMVIVGIVSIRAIRLRMRRESWWVLHLYLYLALAVSFAHEIALGQSFVGHPLTVAVWSAAWAATAGLVLGYRFLLPIVRSLRHGLRVVSVQEEVPGVVSIILKGRQLERLRVAGGQFFEWRFMVPGLWWQAHPYSISALPQPPYLRRTVKSIGDHSSAVAGLRPGTRVAIEGPYGRFTRDVRTHEQVVLLAGGIGVTAIRSLLEDLPPSSRPIVIVRASSAAELALVDELRALAGARDGQLHELVGDRQKFALDRRAIRRLVPDLHRRDAYLCGSEAFVGHAEAALRSAGLNASRIHHEAFSF